MSLIHIAEAHAGAAFDQATIQKMLKENGQLIDTIAEYQRMGRIEDATKYQELLHKNLMYLAGRAEPSLAAQLQMENANAQVNPPTSQPVAQMAEVPQSAAQRYQPPSSLPSTSVSQQRPPGPPLQQATYPQQQNPTPPMVNGHPQPVMAQPPPPQQQPPHFGYDQNVPPQQHMYQPGMAQPPFPHAYHPGMGHVPPGYPQHQQPMR
ncbi:kiaa-iso protein [Aphelenchoides avenae]|nr:kiaa-iso protein [Aphelenchus avenae]